MDKILAKNIKFMLLLHNKRQSDLADFLDVDPITVNRWLNTQRGIRTVYLQKIAAFFGTTVSELYREHTSNTVNYPINQDATVVGEETIQHYLKLIEKEQIQRKSLEDKIKTLEQNQEQMAEQLEELSRLRQILRGYISDAELKQQLKKSKKKK